MWRSRLTSGCARGPTDTAKGPVVWVQTGIGKHESTASSTLWLSLIFVSENDDAVSFLKSPSFLPSFFLRPPSISHVCVSWPPFRHDCSLLSTNWAVWLRLFDYYNDAIFFTILEDDNINDISEDNLDENDMRDTSLGERITFITSVWMLISTEALVVGQHESSVHDNVLLNTSTSYDIANFISKWFYSGTALPTSKTRSGRPNGYEKERVKVLNKWWQIWQLVCRFFCSEEMKKGKFKRFGFEKFGKRKIHNFSVWVEYMVDLKVLC